MPSPGAPRPGGPRPVAPHTAPSRPPTGDAEVVPAVVFEKPPVAGQIIESAPKNYDEAVDKVAYWYDQGNPTRALETARAWAEPVDMTTANKAVEENFRGEIDATSGKRTRTGESDRRHGEATKTLKLIDTMFDKGFDNLKKGERELVLRSAYNVLSGIPEVKAYLGPIRGNLATEQVEALTHLIHNPNYANALRSLMEQRVLGEDGKGIKIPDGIEEATIEKKKAEDTRNAILTQDTDIQTNLTRVEAGIHEFDAPLVPGGPAGSRYSEIDPTAIAKTKVDITTKQSEYDTHKSERETLQKQLNDEKKKAGGGDPAEISRLNGEIATKTSEVKADETELAKLKRTQAEQEQAKKDLDELSKQKTEFLAKQTDIKTKLAAAEATLKTAEKAYKVALSAREDAEENFNKGIQSMLGDAAKAAYLEEAERVQEVQQRLLEEEMANAKSDEEKAILQAIANRYIQTNKIQGPFQRKSTAVRRPNRKQIREDYNKLVTEGPEALMEQVLDEGGIKGPALAAALNNPEFMAKMQPKLLQELVAKRLKVTKMRQSDVEMFVESDWGEGVIENAIAQNKKVQEAIEKLREQGKVQGPFINFLRNTSTGSVLSWIALILMGGIPAAMGLGTNLVLDNP